MIRFRSGMSISCLLVVVLCAPTFANEFLLYPPCNAEVDGTLRAQASVATSVFTCLDTDTCDFDRTVPLSTTGFTFRDVCGVSANVTKSFFDGCQTDAEADVAGRAGYVFVADNDSMSFDFGSHNLQADAVRRGILGVGPGNPVFARSVFDLAGHNQFSLVVPFMVGGGDGASLQVGFGLKRSDSGPSTGQVFATWFVFGDTNGDCAIDATEPLIAMNSLLIFPNQSVTALTMTFATPRGNYILIVSHSFSSDLAADSDDCSDSVNVESTIEHSFDLDFKIITSCP